MIATKDIRIEKDFLGEKEVPSVAYYGVQTLRAVENFPITGYRIQARKFPSISLSQLDPLTSSGQWNKACTAEPGS